MPKKLTDNLSWKEICEKKIEELQREGALRVSSQENKFRKWFLSKKGLPIPFDTLMIYKCYNISLRLTKNYDNVIVIAGLEGDGKSILGINLASWISPDFNKKNICFEKQEYYDILYNLKKGGTVIVDEGAIFLFSRDSTQKENKTMIKTLTVIRSKCVNLIVCVPSFWILDNYIRSHRCNLLIQIIKRGKYIAYNRQGISYINQKGRQEKKVLGLRIKAGNFWHGSCNVVTPPQITLEEYNQLKDSHMDLFLKEAKEEIEESVVKFIPSHKIAKQLGITTQGIIKLIQEGKVQGKKIGGGWFISKQGYHELMDLNQ